MKESRFYLLFVIFILDFIFTPGFSLETRPVILINHYNTTYVNFTIFNPTNEYLLKHKIVLEIYRNDTWDLVYYGLCKEFTLLPGENITLSCEIPSLVPGNYVVFLRRYEYLDFPALGINYNYFYLEIPGKKIKVTIENITLDTTIPIEQDLMIREYPGNKVIVTLDIHSERDMDVILYWILFKRSEISGMGKITEDSKQVSLKSGENAVTFNLTAPQRPYLYELKVCLETQNKEILSCFLGKRFAIIGSNGLIESVRLFSNNTLIVQVLPSMDMLSPVDLTLEVILSRGNKIVYSRTFEFSQTSRKDSFQSWNKTLILPDKFSKVILRLKDRNNMQTYHEEIFNLEMTEKSKSTENSNFPYLVVSICVITCVGVVIWRAVWRKQ